MVRVVYSYIYTAISAIYPVVDTMLTRQSSSEVCRSACRTDWGVAERVRELDSLLCKPVNIWGNYLRVSVRSRGPLSHVVSKEEKNVGPT